MVPCSKCGSTERRYTKQVIADGRTQVRETCRRCGKYIRFAPKHFLAQAEEPGEFDDFGPEF